jgi:hypothetical protein
MVTVCNASGWSDCENSRNLGVPLKWLRGC